MRWRLLIVGVVWGTVHGWQWYSAKRAAKRAAVIASAASVSPSGQAAAPGTVSAAGSSAALPMPQPSSAKAAEPAANFLGIWLVRKVSTERFYRITYLLMFTISSTLTWQGATALMRA